MLNNKLKLMVFCLGCATLAFSANAQAQAFEGCGVLGLTQGEPCLEFFPVSGEYPLGLGRFSGWDDFQEGDRLHVSGQLVKCGGFCTDEGLCFESNSVLGNCIPTVSTWGMITMGLLILVGGTIVIRDGRRIRYSASVFGVFLLFALCAPSFAQESLITQKVNRLLRSPHDAERLLVRFKPGVDAGERANVHAQINATRLKNYRYVDGLTLIKVPAAQLKNTLEYYLNNPNVLYAEPNYIGDVGAIPNDDFFFVREWMWGMHNTGQTVFHNPGTAGADIRAVEAWDIWTGDPDFRIAVIDTGVNYDHPDLNDLVSGVNNIWTNPLEQIGDANNDGCPGICCVDDDGDGLIDECPDSPLPDGALCSWDDDENGYVDDIHGYNFIYNDSDPMDDHKHGSHVAGTIGAIGNNVIGVVGVNWRCKIVALKTLDNGGFGTVNEAIDALEYVIVNDIKLSNNSYGFFERSQAHEDMILASQSIGHIFVAIAHNQGMDIDPVCRPTSLQACCADTDCPVGEYCDASNNGDARAYPAAYCLDNIISVAMTDNDDVLPSWSSYGSTSVDLAAPGVRIWSIGLSSYLELGGTSMAAPHVTGTIALVMSRIPNLTWQEVKQRILDTVRTPIPIPNPLAGKTVTEGIVNAYAALLDCNSNGIDDQLDITSGTSLDCNADNFPDECELDCNTNTVPDECDITSGTSTDCNSNDVPDECESQEDCQPNSVQDICDIATGTSNDCNLNGVPDECESQADCQPNGVQDICDIAGTNSEDCDCNNIPDDCEDHGPTGACCTLDINAPCVTGVTECSCSARDGIFQGASSFCGGLGPKGACCLTGGTCQVNTYKCTCLAQGGNFVGDGTGCFPFTCQQY